MARAYNQRAMRAHNSMQRAGGSGKHALGTELVLNGTFTGGDTTGWTLGSDVTAVGENLSVTNGFTDSSYTYDTNAVVGNYYRVVYTRAGTNTAQWGPQCGSNTLPVSNSPGTQMRYIYAIAAAPLFESTHAVVINTRTVDDVSVRRVYR